MSAASVPEDRCGFTYDVSTLQDVGACSCWRSTWEDGDRCVWHADRNDKPQEAFAAQAPTPGERLDGAIVRKAGFERTDWFAGCRFLGAEFTAVDLVDASVVDADFREATLDHVDARRADFSGADFEDASLSLCDFRHADLEQVRLDHAVITNARISRDTTFGARTVYEEEMADADAPGAFLEKAEAAVWTYREIHNLYESNALPKEARHFYYREKNVRRRLAWNQGHYVRATMSEAARWTTGYGMSPHRVIGTALLLIVVSAVLYPTTGGLQETVAPGGLEDVANGSADAGEQRTITWEIDDPESASPYYLVVVLLRSLYFSVVTFTTLGYGDIRPVGEVARTIAGVEALLGQLFMALLVFVLTRRIS